MYSKKRNPNGALATEFRQRLLTLLDDAYLTREHMRRKMESNMTYIDDAIRQLGPLVHIAGWAWNGKAWTALYTAGPGMNQPKPAKKDYARIDRERLNTAIREKRRELEAAGAVPPKPRGRPSRTPLPQDTGKPVVRIKPAVNGEHAVRDPITAALFGSL
jgi:hypothetical protein